MFTLSISVPVLKKRHEIFRAVFLDALVPLLESSRAHFNKRCIGTQELPNGKMQLTFTDGSQVEADVVLGADGIRSAIRKSVVGANGSGTEGVERENGEIDRVHGVAFTNTIAYRGLVPTHIALQNGVDADFARSPRCLIGKDKVIHFIFHFVQTLMILLSCQSFSIL